MGNILAAGVAPRAKAWRSSERVADSAEQSRGLPLPRPDVDADQTDLYPAILPTSAVTTWDDFCQSSRLLTILTGIVTFVCVFTVSDTGLATHTRQPALARTMDTQHQQQQLQHFNSISRHAANSPGLAVSWRASPAAHRLPFPLILVGHSSLSSPAFLPRPQSCVVAQFKVKPTSLPGDFPVSLNWLQQATKGRTEPLPSARTWEASTVEEAMSTWQKKSGQCDTRNLQHPSGDLSSNNALKVLSHLHAMLQTSRNVFRHVVRPGDPAFHMLTRRTRSPDFLP
ncbi:hypothetical protein LA080_016061 [Diaporthe eres]|nr:hypothetical protein LA080_016061 [Diaporthe eres]